VDFKSYIFCGNRRLSLQFSKMAAIKSYNDNSKGLNTAFHRYPAAIMANRKSGVNKIKARVHPIPKGHSNYGTVYVYHGVEKSNSIKSESR